MFRNFLGSFNRTKHSAADKILYYQLKRVFKITPHNLELFKIALIHKSASTTFSRGKRVNNERLEYLGDAVLDAIVADYLFAHFPDQKEGFLTKMRSRIVSRTNLNNLAITIGLDKLVMSHTSNALAQRHIYGDALEAFVGALFLDKGFKTTNAWVINTIFDKHVDLDELQTTESDYKSRVIEWAQKYKLSISFESQEKETSKKDNPIFESRLFIDHKLLGSGFGNSKKEAEQNASMVALERVDLIPIPENKINTESIGWEN